MTITNKNKIALFALLFPIFALAQESKIDRLFDDFNSHTPGIVITVVQNENLIYSKGHGMSNLAYGVPLTDTSLMDIGSCAKTFTAYAILLLQSEGKLSLDDTITKFLPQFPAYGNAITIRQLGTHTSGIREWIRLFQLSGYNLDEDVILKDHLLKLIYRQEATNFIPGTRFNYSNSNYVLLAEIVEKVSGQSFSSFMRDRIFLPLGMKNTFFHDDLYSIKYNEAARYFQEDLIYKQLSHNNPSPGDGGLYTTSRDMSRWLIHINNYLNSEQNTTELSKQMMLKNGEIISSTFGLYVDPYGGHMQLQHEGGGVGINTYIGLFPDQNLSVLVSCNDSECYPQYYAKQIIDLLLAVKSQVIEKPAPTHNADMMKESQLKEWTGDYWSEELCISRSIIYKNNKLFYARTNRVEDELISTGLNHFTFKGSRGAGIEIWFERTNDGNRSMYYKLQNDPPTYFYESVPFTLNPQELEQYTGIYFSSELKTIYTIEQIDNQLYATHLRIKEVPLRQVMEDMFTGTRTSFGQVLFTRNSIGNVDGFLVSSRNAKGMRFERIAK